MRCVPALVALALSSSALGCSFGSSGVAGAGQLGDSEEGPSSTGAAGDPTGLPSDDDDDVGDDADDDDDDDDDADDTTGPPVGQALLKFADAPAFDFGTVGVSGAAAQFLTLRNDGSEPATAMSGTLAGAFAFRGGDYPGTQGDCGETLEPRTSCTLHVAPAPDEIAVAAGSIEIDYFDGNADATASLDLVANVTTGELILNPGFEDCTDGQPDDWFDNGPGTWECLGETANVDPLSGTTMAAGASGRFNDPFRLAQDVDLSEYATQIDEGTIAFSFTAFAATWSEDDDAYRIVLRYADDQPMQLELFDSEWQTGQAWAEYTDTRVPPTGTRVARVVLFCEKSIGMFCDAFFDDLTLIGSALEK